MRLGNKHLAVDTAAEENGRWVKGPEDWGDVDLLICGTESRAYRAALRERHSDSMTHEQREVMVAELVADHLLKGWRGLVDLGGEPIAYSPATSRAICLNMDNRRLIEFVLAKAIDLRTFDAGAVEQDVKN